MKEYLFKIKIPNPTRHYKFEESKFKIIKCEELKTRKEATNAAEKI